MIKVRFYCNGENYERQYYSKETLVNHLNTQRYIEVIEDVFILRSEIYKVVIIEKGLSENV